MEKKFILFSVLIFMASIAFAQGSALEFDGNDYVNLPASSTILSGTPFTISAWIKTDTQQGSYSSEGRIINTHRGDVTYSTAAAIFAGGSSGGGTATSRDNICFLFCTTTSGNHVWLNYVTPTGNEYHDGNWHHIAASHDGSTATLFYDGVAVASSSATFGEFGTLPAFLGTYDKSGRFFTGTIEEVRFWNVALTATQIQEMDNKELFDDNTPSGISWSDLNAYYKLNDGSGTTIDNITSTTLDGTLATGTNLPSWVTSDAPLPVTLSTFNVSYQNSASVLTWTTQSETDNYGWNIYRSETDNFANSQIQNVEIIDGAGTTSIPTYYSFVDPYEIVPGNEYWYWLENISYSGDSEFHGPLTLTTSTDQEEEDTPEIPDTYGLTQNYPNPFNPSTKLGFALPTSGSGELVIYDIKGRKVKTVFVGSFLADHNYNYVWNGDDDAGNKVSSGIFFYRLTAGSVDQTKKMILMK